MRVISGELRGFQLKGPPSRATRPMNDKLKGALFSMLASLGIAPERVLDLYAGTGSLGIEALSRGATWAEFVDKQAQACDVIRANIAHTKVTGRTLVHQMDVRKFVSQASGPAFDLVLLDPPYADPDLLATLAQVAASPLVQSDGVIAIGHWPRITLPEQVGPLARLRLRCHGDSCFSIYERSPRDGNGEASPASPGEETGR